MTIETSSPVHIAGIQLRAVSEIDLNVRVIGSGVIAHGEKRPIGILIGTGPTSRLVGLDGSSLDLAQPGLVGAPPN